ncbi:MAG: Holliday junction resolvase RuvX [Phycisphaerae bacterium]
MGRLLAVDYGTKRIGLAISDPSGEFVSPAGTIDGRGGAGKDAEQIIAWATKNEIAGIVVGLPYNMDGSIGPQARMSTALARELQRRVSLPVETWDERLSSFQADQWMAEAGVPNSQQAGLRDTLAAVAILKSFLQSKKS